MIAAAMGNGRPVPGWSDPHLAEIADLVREETGLVFSANRIASAEQGIRRAMASIGAHDIRRFRRAAEQPGHERDALIAELTVGESYFFREPRQLDLLVHELMPAMIAERFARGSVEPIRIWSAACSNGEEPYSLAMLLRETRGPRSTEILGTDIALPRLAAARRGRYSEWAMRATPRAMVERWFERSGRAWVLDREIREMVRFQRINLAAEGDGEAFPAGMDVILCRNVLIYFSMDTVARVATRLLAALAPEGWLFVGASDPPLTDLVDCETVTTPAGLAYRRADRPGRATAPAIVVPAAPLPPIDAPPLGSEPLAIERDAPLPDIVYRALPELPPSTAPAVPAAISAPAVPLASAAAGEEIETAYAAADYDRVAALATERIGAGAADERTRVLLVRALANRERLDEAGTACATALERHPLSGELHLLHATLLARAGHHRAAADAARRALYLDPSLLMAQLVAANATDRAGNARGALRALDALAAALAGLPADALVHGADGETAGRLRQIVGFHRDAIRGGAR